MIDYAKQLAEQVKGMSGVDDSMPGMSLFLPILPASNLNLPPERRLRRTQGRSDAEERRAPEIRSTGVEGD